MNRHCQGTNHHETHQCFADGLHRALDQKGMDHAPRDHEGRERDVSKPPHLRAKSQSAPENGQYCRRNHCPHRHDPKRRERCRGGEGQRIDHIWWACDPKPSYVNADGQHESRARPKVEPPPECQRNSRKQPASKQWLKQQDRQREHAGKSGDNVD